MIITLYSGLQNSGCTMAAVNIGAIFSQLKKSTLLIDLNFGTPKLLNYFDKHPINAKTGVFDLLVDYKDMIDGNENITQNKIDRFNVRGNITPIPFLDCLPAKSSVTLLDAEAFNWTEFYSIYNGGAIVEYLRNYWNNEYDVVMAISEKGITSAAAIATIQMPDVLLLLITTQAENLKNSYRVAMAVQRENLAHPDRQTIILPILSRIESAEAHLRAEFRDRVTDQFSVFFPKGIDPQQYFDNMVIPNYPYATYNNDIFVLHKNDDRLALRAVYSQIANNILGMIEKSRFDN